MATKIEQLTDGQKTRLAEFHAEWFAHGTNTARADRPTAEAAITEMYRIVGEPTPVFIWCDSPATSMLGIEVIKRLRATKNEQAPGSLGDSLRGSLWGSLRDSLGDSLRGSLGDSLRDSLGDSLRGSLWGSLRGSLWGSLRGSLWGSLRGSLWDSLRGSLRDHLGQAWWGQHDANWIAYYLFPADELGVAYDAEKRRHLQLWADIARSCGWWWPYRGLCVVSERPTRVEMEITGTREGMPVHQLHNARGPALEYADGWTVHAWHGTRVPGDLIEGAGWDIARIASEANTEIRRCAIERRGWDRYLDELGVTPVDVADDPGNPGHQLKLYDLPDTAQVYGERVRLIVMHNASRDRDGSRRMFAETVPAHIATAVDASAWQFDCDPDLYRSLVRAT